MAQRSNANMCLFSGGGYYPISGWKMFMKKNTGINRMVNFKTKIFFRVLFRKGAICDRNFKNNMEKANVFKRFFVNNSKNWHFIYKTIVNKKEAYQKAKRLVFYYYCKLNINQVMVLESRLLFIKCKNRNI